MSSGKQLVLHTKSGGIAVKQHSEEEWLAVLPHISRLYLDEKMGLGDVMRTMEVEHDFSATESMYKKRIRKWHLWKYKREKRPVRRVSPDRPVQSVAMSRRVSDSKEAETMRFLLSLVRDWSNAADRSGNWVAFSFRDVSGKGVSPSDWVIRSGSPSEQELTAGQPCVKTNGFFQVYESFSLAMMLSTRGQGLLTGKALRKAFLMVETALRSQHPGFEWIITEILYLFVQRGSKEVVVAFTTHIANLARLLLPQNHPLITLASRFSSYDGDPCTMLQVFYSCQVDIMRADATAWGSKLTSCWRTSLVSKVSQAQNCNEGLEQMVQEMIEVYCNAGALNGQKLTGVSHSEEDPAASSLPMYPIASEETDRLLFFEYTPEVLETYRLKVHADQRIYEGDTDAAVEATRKLVTALERFFGKDDYKVISQLWAFERLLIKVGREAEAKVAREDATERVTAYLADIPDNSL